VAGSLSGRPRATVQEREDGRVNHPSPASPACAAWRSSAASARSG
jgi:hypothetical protein